MARLGVPRRQDARCVDKRQDLVAAHHGGARPGERLGTEEPRLAALRVDVRVRAEEWLVDRCLVPTLKELDGGVSEEAADVRAGERHPRDVL